MWCKSWFITRTCRADPWLVNNVCKMSHTYTAIDINEIDGNHAMCFLWNIFESKLSLMLTQHIMGCIYIVLLCTFQTDCQLCSAASDMSLGLCILHNFSGMKRTCWTTGSWRCCLRLEVVSSILAGSTINIGCFVVSYAFSCARASKSNHQIFIVLS